MVDPINNVAIGDEEKDCDNLDKSREKHRFYIAVILLGSLLIIILIPVINTHYDNAFELAAIFGGWIGSVMGFYFLQENTDKAQRQTAIAIKDAAEARKDVLSVSKTQVNLADIWEVTSLRWKKRAEYYYERSTIYEGLYEKAEILINEMLQEFDRDAEGR